MFFKPVSCFNSSNNKIGILLPTLTVTNPSNFQSLALSLSRSLSLSSDSSTPFHHHKSQDLCKMRTFTLISILLLSILVHEAQGIRLAKGSLSGRISEVHENQNDPKRSNVGIEEPDLCKDTPCLESGMKRKLTTKTTSASSTTTPTIKKNKNDHGNSKAEEENLSVKSSTLNEKPDNVPARYPDIIDIAGMDYSPARRKPPIHN